MTSLEHRRHLEMEFPDFLEFQECPEGNPASCGLYSVCCVASYFRTIVRYTRDILLVPNGYWQAGVECLILIMFVIVIIDIPLASNEVQCALPES